MDVRSRLEDLKRQEDLKRSRHDRVLNVNVLPHKHSLHKEVLIGTYNWT